MGQNAILATPAASAVIRRRKLFGGLIMSASHNPGGPEEDWGIKFNYNSGEPAPERITDAIFEYTTGLTEIQWADLPDMDLATVGSTTFGDFEVRGSDLLHGCEFLYARGFCVVRTPPACLPTYDLRARAGPCRWRSSTVGRTTLSC